MSRELKFRVWDGECFRGNLKKYFLNLHDGEISEVAYSDLYDEYYDASERGSKLIIQQYTGLKDRHEKEIYEGDIVKIIYDEAVAEVYFDFNLGAFRLKDNSGKSYPITTYRFDESNKPIGLISVADEVVGNIMENPELLKA
jgi:uncharacterized phage protein (TIGR01671 family)